MAKKPAAPKSVEALTHDEAKRKNIPTAEFQSVLKTDEQKPVRVRYSRNTYLDPQLVWRGKDEQDWSDLVVHAPPVYIQRRFNSEVQQRCIDNMAEHRGWGKGRGQGRKSPAAMRA